MSFATNRDPRMPYRKGELTKRRKLEDWPHHVAVSIPDTGLGDRLNEMHGFCQGVDYVTASDYGPGKPDRAIWCFKSKEDAEAFKERFVPQPQP